MFKFMMNLLVMLVLSFSSLVSSAGTPPITAIFESSTSTISFPSGSSIGTANYLVSVNPLVKPKGYPISLNIKNLPTWAAIVGGASQCPATTQSCGASFSLRAGESCCLMLRLDGTNLVAGGYSLQPYVESIPAAFSFSAELLKVTVGPVDTHLRITSTLSADTQVNVNYSQSNVASGGTKPYTYAVFSGRLPSGTTLNSSTGLVLGTPSSVGSFSYIIMVTDAAANTAISEPISGTIAGDVSIASTPSVIAEDGLNYSQSNVASNGSSPYTYSVVSGGVLPVGAVLDASTGFVSGFLTATTSFSYQIKVTDTNGATATGALTFGNVLPAVSITTSALGATEIGIAYSQLNQASGGSGGYVYTLYSGALPLGTMLHPSTGTVDGTPTAVGSFSYVIQVVDSNGSKVLGTTVSGTIVAAVTIVSTESSVAEEGINYSQSNVASNGVTPYTYSYAGTLPDGANLNSAGLVSGDLTTPGQMFSYTVTVTDDNGKMATGLTMGGTVKAAVSIASTASAKTEVGINYSQTNVASGGTPPFIYTLYSGALPAGTTLNAGSGTVSGTPTTAGNFSYVIKVVGAQGSFSIGTTVSGTIASAVSIVSTPTVVAEVGVFYSQSNVASGGTQPFTYTVATGHLPAGTSLSSAGLVAGRPTGAESYSYSIKVTDANGSTSTGAIMSGTIKAAVQLASAAPQGLEVDAEYSQVNMGNSGTSPYSYSLYSGTLPAGTSLIAATGVVSGLPSTAGAFSYVIKVTDAVGSTAIGTTVTGTIVGGVSLTSASPSGGTDVGGNYTQVNTVVGGTGPFTYTVSSGALPGGTTINPNGTVSGALTTQGPFSYVIKVTDANNEMAIGATISGTINGTISLASTPSLDTEVGVSYVQTNIVSGGTPPFSYSLSSGTLPAGTRFDTLNTGSVTGTPTTPGPFSYVVKVTDSNGIMAVGTPISGTITAVVTLTATPSAKTEVGTTYSQLNTVSGGRAPYTYTLYSGALPTPTTLGSTTGTVSGIPNTPGNFSYVIKVTDADGSIGIGQTESGTIAAAVSLVSTPSSVAEVGIAYSQTNVTNGGTGPYTYTVSSGTLPAGTQFDTLNPGWVTGTPSAAGPFSYAITVTDSDGSSATGATISGTVNAAISMVSTASATTEVGVNYSQTNVASGGTRPYLYTLYSGSLPLGTSLNASSGLVSGKPTAAGSFSYVIQVLGAQGSLFIGTPSNGTIAGVVSIVSTPSGVAEVGIAYSQSNIASGGTRPYIYSVASGALPAGTSLSASTGLVSGAPTATQTPSFSYAIEVTDANGQIAVGDTILGSITPAVSIMSTPSAKTEVNVAYLQANTASGGTTPYVYTVYSGIVPLGTHLEPSTGVVTGTPTTASSFSYVIKVTGFEGSSAIGSVVSGTIAAPVSVVSTPSNVTEVGIAYSQSNVASGGTFPYTYSVSSGTLPPNTSLNPASGFVSGVPQVAQSFNYIISATDADGLSASGTPMAGTVVAAVSLASIEATATEVGIFYSQTNVVSGGTAPFTYTVVSGSLPANTTLGTDGSVTGTPFTAGAFSYAIKVTDKYGSTYTGALLSGNINQQLSMVSTLSNESEVNVLYSQANQASNGTTPYQFKVYTGNLPDHTRLDSGSGTVSGTPQVKGGGTYIIQVTDNDGAVIIGQSISWAIAGAVTIASTSATVAEVGVAYSQSSIASGGTLPYAYTAVNSTSLPAGTSLDRDTGLVSGMPSLVGVFSYQIQVTDANGQTALGTLVRGTILPAVTLTSTPSSELEVGQTYSQSNQGNPGTAPYRYSLSVPGTLPAGTTLDSATGIVSGMLTTSGAFSYVIDVTDAVGSIAVGEAVTGTIVGTVNLDSTPSATTEVGINYTQTNGVTGGQSPYTYMVSTGFLPAGTSLVGSTVTGTPTTAGPFSYVIKVTDNLGVMAVGSTISGNIAGLVSVASTPSVNTEVGVSYSQKNVARGGTPGYTYSVDSGTLPIGTELNSATGLVLGVPTAGGGVFSYAVKATDQDGSMAVGATITGTIAPVVTVQSNNPSTFLEVDVPYSQTNTALGGSGSYTFSIYTGALPGSVTLNSTTGTVSGTPTLGQSFSYAIKATDTDGSVGIGTTISGTIADAVVLASTPSSVAEVMVAYSQMNVASEGTLPYASYSTSTGTLPAGTTLNTSSGLVSGTPTTVETFDYTIQVVDGAGKVATGEPIRGQVQSAVRLASDPPSSTEVGVAYLQHNAASGGAIPYTFTVYAGSVPAGTNLGTDGDVTGLPTAPGGGFSYIIQVTGAQGTTALGATISGTIASQLTLAATPSVSTAFGVNYSQSNVASGGTPPYSYAVTAGSAPQGTALDLSTGLVSGTPTQIGSFSYTITVTDNDFNTANQPTSGTIASAPPTAPTDVLATSPGDALATVSWSAPANTGNGSITGYTVTPYIGTTAQTSTTVGDVTSTVITGLANGTAYTFTVAAINSAGTGAESSRSNAVTPVTTPGAPTIGVATALNPNSAKVTFTAGSNGGSPVEFYTVSSNPAGYSKSEGASPITVSGLYNGTSYTFTVTAFNAQGLGPASGNSNEITAAVPPGAPTMGTATAVSSNGALVTFTAPGYTGGSVITSYTATSNPGGFTASAATSPITVPGLTQGESYTFTVTASNAVGVGAASGQSNAIIASAVPGQVPGAATAVIAAAGNAQATVNWTAPSSGGAVVSYVVTSSGGQTCTTLSPSLTCTVLSLNNGTSYTFTVVAFNTNGVGPASNASNAVTPSATPGELPGTPTSVIAAAGNTTASVTWTAPSTGGAVVSYVVTSSGGQTCTALSPTLTCAITSLNNGTSYTFTVVALNTNGQSPASIPSNAVIPSTSPDLPGEPTAVIAVAGNASAVVSWSAPTTGGAVATYTVTSSPGAETCTTTPSSLTCTFASLTNGVSYTFTVVAFNTSGGGPAAVSSPVTPSTVPDLPTSVTPSPGNGQVTLSWVESFNGGAPITSYTVTSSPAVSAPSTCTAEGNTGQNYCTFTGLTNGTSYTFTVIATNMNGDSATSDVSSSVVPSTTFPTVPGVPLVVAAVQQLTTGDVLVSWSPPVNAGGATISGYTVTYGSSSPYSSAGCSAVPPALSCTISAVAAGTAYTFAVTATNAAGTGAAAYSSPLTLNTGALFASPSTLALSINALYVNEALTGNPRTITITNRSGVTVSGVNVSDAGLPSGTEYSTTCSSTLAAHSSCTITVTPGSSATLGIGSVACTTGIAPTPGTITVSGHGVVAVTTNVVVLGYSCIYQDGYLFSVDDTTPTTSSIGGTVVSVTNNANTKIWSVTSDNIWGISNTSTVSNPNPNSTLQSGQLNCNGNIDGVCDTNNIYTVYSADSHNTYAAGVCTQPIDSSGYNDWYLPSICEMGVDSTNIGSNCGASSSAPLIQNILSNVYLNGALGNINGYYWSATEVSGSDSALYAFVQYYAPSDSSQGLGFKTNDIISVRCARVLTP